MSTPKVSVIFSNGNLLQDISALDGICAACGTGYTPGLLGVPKMVSSLPDAITQGFTEEDEPVAYRHIKEFYDEIGGNIDLYVMLVPETMTLAQMVTNTNENGAKKLLTFADKKAALLGIFRKPGTGYDPGDDMIDADVEAALLTSKTFGDARRGELAFCRVLVEGRVANNDIQAAGSYTVTVAGTAGNKHELKVNDGETDIVIGSYTVVNGDTAAQAAAGLRAAIAALTSTHGYTVSGTGAVVDYKAPVNTGSNGNSYTTTTNNTGTAAGTLVQLSGGTFTVPNTLEPKESANGYAGVVLGGSLPDNSASVGTALGRAAKYGAEIKIGKVANGPLSLTTCYIGNKAIKDVANLDSLHGAGFISFMQHPNKAGFYFGLDRMASTDDYRLLAYGRVIDKAARIAAAVYTESLEGEVLVDAQGNIDSLELAALKARIEQQILVSMGAQISGIEAVINPNQNIINTSKLLVKLRVRPLGYTSFIDVDLGLSAPSASN